MRLAPLHDRILVLRDTIKEIVKESGFIIPEQAQEKPQTGRVIEIGTEVKDIHVEDKIMFGKHDGQTVTLDDVVYLVLRENQVWGVVHETN